MAKRPYYLPAVTCKASGCDDPVKRNRHGHGMGYCDAHYGSHGARTRRVGDRWPDVNGYIQTKTPDGRVVAEHRWVMEQQLGRSLTVGESVHHINGDRSDNRLENLELWFSAQPYGQRVTELLTYISRHHAEAILALLAHSDSEDPTEENA